MFVRQPHWKGMKMNDNVRAVQYLHWINWIHDFHFRVNVHGSRLFFCLFQINCPLHSPIILRAFHWLGLVSVHRIFGEFSNGFRFTEKKFLGIKSWKVHRILDTNVRKNNLNKKRLSMCDPREVIQGWEEESRKLKYEIEYEDEEKEKEEMKKKKNGESWNWRKK